MYGFSKLAICIGFVLSFLAGCSSEEESRIQKKHFALLGPIQNAEVSIKVFQSETVLERTRTLPLQTVEKKLVWRQFGVGSFDIDTTSLPKNQWLLVEVSGGEDVDVDDDGVVDDVFLPLNGKVSLLCKASDLSQRVVVNPFSTLAVILAQHKTGETTLESFLNDFAKKLFVCSIDEDDRVDYHDLFGYIPGVTDSKCLAYDTLFENLHKYGVITYIQEGKDLYALLQSDKDGDGLILYDELLAGSSPAKIDSDGDGISDYEELQKGLDPTRTDSDADGIMDNEEALYGTDPQKSDTDGDYLPDGVEIKEGSDPLEADENGNATADGLDNDPFFKYQWYIKSEGGVIVNTAGIATIKGNDLGILDVYHSYLGGDESNKTVIQIVDTGVEATHEDLDIDWNNSFNAVTHTHDPTPTQKVGESLRDPIDIGHGTAAAGIVAARTNNG